MAKKATTVEPTTTNSTIEKENKIMSRKCNMSAKDMINAKTSSVQLKSAPERFNCTALAVTEDLDKETGEMREVGYVVAENGTVYGTISATALSSIEAIIDAVEGDDISLPCEIGVSLRKSNAGREFITLSVF
jgi:hypothetical protein